MLVFSSTPGVVGAIVTGQTLPFSIAIGGTNGVAGFPSYLLAKAVLTGFKYGGRSGLGFTHTLRDRIYLYVSGERMGEVEISGVGFAGACGVSPNQGGNWTGFDSIYAYYERVRASTQGQSCRLILGPRTTIAGFMSDVSFSLDDPQTAVGSFTFKFAAVPRVINFGETRVLPWE